MPELRRDLDLLRARGWDVDLDASLRFIGNDAVEGFTDRTAKRLGVDARLRRRIDERTATAAHEAGHALLADDPQLRTGLFDAHGSGLHEHARLGVSEQLDALYADEGAAILREVASQREALTNGAKPLPPVRNRRTQAAIDKVYDRYLQDGNAVAARDEVGRLYCLGVDGSETFHADFDRRASEPEIQR